jgi:uncharacterized membrane protein
MEGVAPLHWREWMQGLRRRVIHAVVFELFAVAIVTTAFALLTEADAGRSGVLAAACSLVAMAWNMGYNKLFELWEARQASQRRSVWRRMAHALGFELGLVVLLVPLIAWWLDIGLWQALVLDVGLMLFFLVYTYAFNWLFDHVFGLPRRPTACPGVAHP